MIGNDGYIKQNVTTDEGVPVPYRWTHGATDMHMGDGLIVYSIIQHMRAKHCVCIGSGGGYIPRIMTLARQELHYQGIFEGDGNPNYGDIGATYLVDPCNGIGGPSNVDNSESFYRREYGPRFIKSTSEEAYYDYFVRQDIKIDVLFIDGDHSYEGVKKDFELYSTILSENGIIIIHDTDKDYEETLIVSEDSKPYHHKFDGPSKLIEELKYSTEWNLINLFNFRILPTKPSSSGITILNRKK
jgi:Methyltransferase domain